MSHDAPHSPDFRQAALAHLDALYSYAVALSHNRTEAEDLVQETYLRAMRAFGQLPPDSQLKGWLFTILRNVWLNQQRRAQGGPQFIPVSPEEDDRLPYLGSLACNPHFVYVQKARREQVRAAIAQLPPAHREVIVLRDFEGFSYQEIAGILQCPAGTVMSRLNRAREQLRRLLSGWQAEVV